MTSKEQRQHIKEYMTTKEYEAVLTFVNKPLYTQHLGTGCKLHLSKSVLNVDDVYRVWRCETHNRFVYEYPLRLRVEWRDGTIDTVTQGRNG